MRRLVAKERHRHATEGERVGLCEVVESAHRHWLRKFGSFAKTAFRRVHVQVHLYTLVLVTLKHKGNSRSVICASLILIVLRVTATVVTLVAVVIVGSGGLALARLAPSLLLEPSPLLRRTALGTLEGAQLAPPFSSYHRR